MQNRFYSDREIGLLANPTGGFLAWFRDAGRVTFVCTEDGDPEVFSSEAEAEAEAFAHASINFVQG